MKECLNCGSYNAYYTKGYKQFNKEKAGYCGRQKCIVTNHDTCENWRKNTFRRYMNKTISLKQLYEFAENISEITQILREEFNEKES